MPLLGGSPVTSVTTNSGPKSQNAILNFTSEGPNPSRVPRLLPKEAADIGGDECNVAVVCDCIDFQLLGYGHLGNNDDLTSYASESSMHRESEQACLPQSAG